MRARIFIFLFTSVVHGMLINICNWLFAGGNALICSICQFLYYKYTYYYDQLREHIEKQRHYSANKDPSSQGYGFSCGHVWIWELDCEESWVPKNWFFWTMVLHKTLESPLDCKEIQPVHSKGDQPCCSLEGMMLKLKLQYFGHLCEELTHWKRLWCWEGLGAGGEGDDRGWDGWMASPTRWTWVWVNSGRQLWTGGPGVIHGVAKSRTRLSN